MAVTRSSPERPTTAADPAGAVRFRLDGWTVEPDTHRLRRDDGRIEPLEPRVMALLVELAATPGEVRERASLLDAVWPDVAVSDESLTVAVSELRRALGDDSRRPRYVETIRKRGYRLALIPEPLADPASPAPQTVPTLHRGDRRLALVVAGLAAVVAVATAVILRYGAPEATASVQPVTSFPGSEFHPDLSPDGRSVAFGRRQPDADGSDLWLVPVDDPRPRRLTGLTGFAYRPQFSNDGTWLAFAWVEDVDGPGAGRVGVVAAAGGEVRWLAETPRPVVDMAWGPRGGELLAVTADAGPGELLVVPATGGETRTVVVPGMPALGAIAAARNGDAVVLTTAAPGSQEVWLTSWPSGRPRQVTRGLRRIEGLALAADGTSVVVAAAPERRFHLWRVDLETGAARRWPWRVEDVLEPTVGPDGTIVAERFVMACDIWRIPLAGSAESILQPLVVAPSTLRDTAPAPAPDGVRLAMVSERAGRMAPWILAGDGDEVGRPVAVPEGVVDRVRWFADGRRLLVSLEVAGGVDLVEVDADSGAVGRRVRWRGGSLVLGAVEPAGEAVLAVDGDTRRVVWVPLDGGPRRDLGGPADAVLAVPTDGSGAVVSDGGALRLVPADGGPATDLETPPGVTEWVRAAATGCVLVGLETREGAAALTRLDLCEGGVTPAGRVADWGQWLVQDPVVSADGTSLWLMRGRYRDGLDLVRIGP